MSKSSTILPLEEKLIAQVQNLLQEDVSGHDFHHVERVVSVAKKLIHKQEVNLETLLLIAYLHDVDDPKIVSPNTPSRAKRILEELQITSNQQTLILDEIENLSYSSYLAGKKVSTLEGQIVQDSDRLDAIGAIGIARAFAYGGKKGRTLFSGSFNDDSSVAHFYQKLLHLEKLMNTKKAKKIAKKRHRILRRFLKDFHHDWQSKI